MKVAIYEHLHLSWGWIYLQNIWFHGGTEHCGHKFQILCKSSFMNICFFCVVLYACIIFGFMMLQATVAVHSKYDASRHLWTSGSVMGFDMLALYLISFWYIKLWLFILNIKQGVIYKHLHQLWGSICLYNVWFRGGTGNCGCPF